MKDLFFMECKKIAGSILYWLYVAVLAITSILNYDTAVDHELRRTDDPACVFYTSKNGVYANAVEESDETVQRAMMAGATNRLLDNYRNNRYEYYPFGYVKEKKLSKKEQGMILSYLEELTGLPETAITGMGVDNDFGNSTKLPETPATGNRNDDENNENCDTENITGLPESNAQKTDRDHDLDDIEISGGGAYILNPGKGGTYKNGQFVTQPDDWEYVENPFGNSGVLDNSNSESLESSNQEVLDGSKSEAPENSNFEISESSNPKAPGNSNSKASDGSTPETPGNSNSKASDGSTPEAPGNSNSVVLENSNNSTEIQVSFDRFKEIMEHVSSLIGRNSYFSQTMLSMYYCSNDMQDNPVTKQQHQEFYENDHVTGAFARYFCDSISLIILCLPAFVIIDLLLKDKRCKMKALLDPRTAASGKIIFTRFLAAVAMAMLPVLLLPLRSLVTLIIYCNNIGVHADLFAFAIYIFAWIFPTVLFVVSIALFVTVLTDNYSGILISGLIWLFGRPAIDKMAGGNYGVFDLVIRHNTLKGYGRMMDHIQMLVFNRVLISAVAFLLVALAVVVYDAKRKGGIVFGNKKFFDAYRRKYSH